MSSLDCCSVLSPHHTTASYHMHVLVLHTLYRLLQHLYWQDMQVGWPSATAANCWCHASPWPPPTTINTHSLNVNIQPRVQRAVHHIDLRAATARAPKSRPKCSCRQLQHMRSVQQSMSNQQTVTLIAPGASPAASHQPSGNNSPTRPKLQASRCDWQATAGLLEENNVNMCNCLPCQMASMHLCPRL